MKMLRLVFVVAICAAAVASAQQRVEAQSSAKSQPGIGLGINAPALMTPDAVEKLKLSAEQKEKYGKIEVDYKDAAKSVQDAFRTSIQGKGDLKEALDKKQADTKKAREDALARVEPLLTEEQKTVFAQVKLQQPAPGGRPLPPIGAGIGQVLPPVTQQRLQLTDEQKKQIEAIQKEVEAKVMKVLTDDQKKQLEGMKKGPTIIIRPLPGGPPQPLEIQLGNPNPRPADPANKD